MTCEIKALASWLSEAGCEMAAMESTGSYWKPLYNLFELLNLDAIIVNASHMKAVPGRKTDVKDAEWIADLLQHGLLRASFVPDRAQRELREIFMTKTPQELGLRGQVWTQGQAAEFVRRTYRIALAPRTMSAYLARWRAQSRRPRGRLTVEEKKKKKPLL